MTYRDVFDSAVKLLSEDSHSGFTEDYEERATYILATFTLECAAADCAHRSANSLPVKKLSPVTCVDLDENFPLSDVFFPAATFYLSALLAIDENESLGDKLFDRYSDALSAILSHLPTSSSKTVDRYHLL